MLTNIILLLTTPPTFIGELGHGSVLNSVRQHSEGVIRFPSK